MSALQHSEACVEETQAFDRKLKEWDAKWPNACKHCGGAGAWHSYGGREEPPDGGPCSECTEKGLCARCGQPGLTDEDRGDKSTGDGPCKLCGWDYDDVRPELDGPCACEEAAMEDAGRMDEDALRGRGHDDGAIGE